MTLLDVRDLSVRYEPKARRPLDAVQEVSFAHRARRVRRPHRRVRLGQDDARHRAAAAAAAAGPHQRRHRSRFDGTDITHLPEDELRALRWRDISTVFQSSMNSLNPVVRVEGQFRDAIEQHSTLRGEAVTRRIRELLRHGHHRPEVHDRLPARAVRRHAAAGQPRPRPGARAEVRPARRADHRARRGRAALDPRERAAAAGRAGLRRALHQPRHRHRARPLRPHPGDVCRPHRRGPERRGAAARAAAPLHEGAARLVRRPARRRPWRSPTSRAGRRTSAATSSAAASRRAAPSASSSASRRSRRSCRCGGGRAACHVAVLQREDGGAVRFGEAEARLRGPAVRQDGRRVTQRADQRGRAVGARTSRRSSSVVAGSPSPGPRPSATSASSCAAAR